MQGLAASRKSWVPKTKLRVNSELQAINSYQVQRASKGMEAPSLGHGGNKIRYIYNSSYLLRSGFWSWPLRLIWNAFSILTCAQKFLVNCCKMQHCGRTYQSSGREKGRDDVDWLSRRPEDTFRFESKSFIWYASEEEEMDWTQYALSAWTQPFLPWSLPTWDPVDTCQWEGAIMLHWGRTWWIRWSSWSKQPGASWHCGMMFRILPLMPHRGSNSCDSLRELQGNVLNVLNTLFRLDPPDLQMVLFSLLQT